MDVHAKRTGCGQAFPACDRGMERRFIPATRAGHLGMGTRFKPLYFVDRPATEPLPREEQEAYGQEFLDATGEVTLWESGESIRIAKELLPKIGRAHV